jgi:hypothetical protein
MFAMYAVRFLATVFADDARVVGLLSCSHPMDVVRSHVFRHFPHRYKRSHEYERGGLYSATSFNRRNGRYGDTKMHSNKLNCGPKKGKSLNRSNY